MDPNSYFHIVSEVNTTWDKVKRIPDYKTVVGKVLFQNLFKLCSPGGNNNWSMFPFSKSYDRSNKEALFDDPTFAKHASNFVQMLDLAIHMLGPDMDLLEETLLEVGTKHMKYGVTPRHYPLMGRALLETLEKVLGRAFTNKSKEAWAAIYIFFSTSMVQGAYESLC